jgi:succinate dehydrogenase / fumarate reductase, membrane anchor subunit
MVTGAPRMRRAPEGLRSPLGRAVGLGSAKEGVAHWVMQRVTAVALVPLALWFVAAVIELTGADFDAMQNWVGRPLPAIGLILLLVATFYHAALGLQVVIEDYVYGALARFGLVILTRLACVALAVAGIVAVLALALGAD